MNAEATFAIAGIIAIVIIALVTLHAESTQQDITGQAIGRPSKIDQAVKPFLRAPAGDFSAVADRVSHGRSNR